MANALTTPSVSLVNLKGGVGKTALTVNLAFALAEWHDKAVLVVDIDPQFNATQHLLEERVIIGELSGHTIKDILDPAQPTVNVGKPVKRPAAKPESFLRSVPGVQGGTIDLLPSLLDLSFVSRNPHGKEGRLEQYLQKVQSNYDIILIDCPPTISVLSHAAFNASRYYVVPVTPDYFAPIGIPLIEEEVSFFKDNLHAASGEMIPLGIVYTIVDTRWHADWKAVARRVNDVSTIEAFATHFTQSKYWRECAAGHEPVYRSRPHSASANQLRDFTQEFLNRLTTSEAERTNA